MIECRKFRYVGKGAIVGNADLYVPQFGLHIYNCTVFQKDGRRWLSFPSKEKDVNGEKKFFPQIRFEKRESMDNFTIQAMKAIQPEIDAALSEPKREDDIDGLF